MARPPTLSCWATCWPSGSTSAVVAVVAVDANPDFGTLAALAPDKVRSERSLADLLGELRKIDQLAIGEVKRSLVP